MEVRVGFVVMSLLRGKGPDPFRHLGGGDGGGGSR